MRFIAEYQLTRYPESVPRYGSIHLDDTLFLGAAYRAIKILESGTRPIIGRDEFSRVQSVMPRTRGHDFIEVKFRGRHGGALIIKVRREACEQSSKS